MRLYVVKQGDQVRAIFGTPGPALDYAADLVARLAKRSGRPVTQIGCDKWFIWYITDSTVLYCVTVVSQEEGPVGDE